MAKLIIELASSVTGKVLGDFTWDWCKTLSANADVSVAGATLTERGFGVYVLNNPNVAEDSDFRLHLTADATQFASGIFSLSDGDLARQSTLTTVKAKTDNLPASPASEGNVTAVGAAVAAIPTNPLLATDARLDNLDAPVSLLNHATYGLNALLAAIGEQGNLTAADVWGYVTRSLTDKAGFEIDTSGIEMDLTPVTTRLDDAGYGLAALKAGVDGIEIPVPPTVQEIRQEIDANSAKLADVATGSELEVVQQSILSAIDFVVADPFATVVPGSDPPITRGEAIDKLYVPAYEGPVVVEPVNVDPDVQYVHVYGKKGDNTPSVGRKVVAVPVMGQLIAQNLIDKERREATLDVNGYALLVLIRGLKYAVTASWWDQEPVVIAVNDDDNRTLSAYIKDIQTGEVPVPPGIEVMDVEVL